MEKERNLKKLVASAELKGYFIKVQEFTAEGKKFCVALDMVWPLAYTRKDAAVRELKNKFVEGEDYIITSETVDTQIGGVSRRADIKLSAKCLEHFIATKVPAVFEVYRKVFHKAVEEVQDTMVAELPNFKNPAEAARAWAHQFELKEAARESYLKAAKEVKELKPDAEYAKTVLKAKGAYTMDDMAKHLNISSGRKLAAILQKKKVLLKATAPYKLSAKYIGKNHPEYVKYGTEVDERKYSRATLTWTEEGKRLLNSLSFK